MTAGGRGAVNGKGFAMKIADGPSDTVGGQPADSAAETVLLQWDKSSPATLVFYANKKAHRFAMSDCVGTIKLLLSKDGVTWTEVWKKDKKWNPSGFEPVYTVLPLTADDTQFALKWAYTGQECFVTTLDDITFLAVPPEGVKESPPASIDPLTLAAASRSKGTTGASGGTDAAGSPSSNTTNITMPTGVPPPPFPPTFEATCSWAAQYCGSAPALKNGTAKTLRRKVNTTTITTLAAGLLNTTSPRVPENAADEVADDGAESGQRAKAPGGNLAAQNVGRKLRH
jgi:hypothetical protein